MIKKNFFYYFFDRYKNLNIYKKEFHSSSLFLQEIKDINKTPLRLNENNLYSLKTIINNNKGYVYFLLVLLITKIFIKIKI